MKITILLGNIAKVIECNINKEKFADIAKEFEDWLYEDSGKGYLQVKTSLNVQILDINVVLRFFNEMYPECSAKVINQQVLMENVDNSLPVIAL